MFWECHGAFRLVLNIDIYECRTQLAMISQPMNSKGMNSHRGCINHALRNRHYEFVLHDYGEMYEFIAQ